MVLVSIKQSDVELAGEKKASFINVQAYVVLTQLLFIHHFVTDLSWSQWFKVKFCFYFEIETTKD